MYLPQHFAESRPQLLHELIRSYPFCTLVVLAEGELIANHIPMLLDPDSGPHGTLRGHVSRSNSVWSHLEGIEALAIFQGPHAYISPNWYPSRQSDGKVVPTWNYAVVHAYGHARAIQDPAWLLENVSRLTVAQEAGQMHPWQVADAPRDYIEQMLRGIVGVELPVSRMQGKWKVSQNRTQADRLGAVAGLQSRSEEQAHAMAALIAERAR